MRTGILHPMRVRKRLCVSVLDGKQSIYFSRFLKYFGFGGVFVKQIVIFYIGFGFVVLNSIWWLGLKICFDIRSNTFKKRPRSVNNFRTKHLGWYLWDFWPLTSHQPANLLPTSRRLLSCSTCKLTHKLLVCGFWYVHAFESWYKSERLGRESVVRVGTSQEVKRLPSRARWQLVQVKVWICLSARCKERRAEEPLAKLLGLIPHDQFHNFAPPKSCTISGGVACGWVCG